MYVCALRRVNTADGVLLFFSLSCRNNWLICSEVCAAMMLTRTASVGLLCLLDSYCSFAVDDPQPFAMSIAAPGCTPPC